MSTHPDTRTASLTSLALVAFASNSILCRLALGRHLIDAGTFTSVRLLSGAAALVALVILRDRRPLALRMRWQASIALFAYAAPFSFAYLLIPASGGALVLFGAVQATMIGWEILQGKRLDKTELIGLALALSGLVTLTLPGTTGLDLTGVGLMAVAGIAWGVYSLLGRGVDDPLFATAGNFAFSVVFAIPMAVLSTGEWNVSQQGLVLAVASGALASGIGYAVWYTALRGLSSTQAAMLQLLVPVIAAIGGVVFLDETVSLRLVGSGILIFAGVFLAIVRIRRG